MSVHAAGGSTNQLVSTSNLSNPQSQTKLIWVKHDATPSGYNALLWSADGPANNYAGLDTGSTASKISVQTGSATETNFASNPATWTDWVCYILTATTAGAGSCIGYWQDNSGGGFTSQAATGVNFTTAYDVISGALTNGLTLAYYMEWSVVLTGAQMNTQFLSATPVVQTGNLRRYLALANAATAGTDTSGSGFNMTVGGTITDGTGLPTFPVPLLSAGGLDGGLNGGFQ